MIIYKVKTPYSLCKMSRKRVRWPTKVLSARVSENMYDTVMDIVHKGNYADVTDYLRYLIRRDFEARGTKIE